MGLTLPGGFSPVNALGQLGDTVNPYNGSKDYDVFSQRGDQRNGMNANQWIASQTPRTTNSGLPAPTPTGTQTDGQTDNYTQNIDNTAASRAQAAADAEAKAAALYGIDSGIQSANDGLGRLDSQLNTGLGNIDRDYQAAYQRLTGQRNVAGADFNNNKTDQLNQYQSARNQNNTAARGFLDSSRRTLGAQGAGGGSAARYALPYQAQQQAAATNGAAQATNSRNISALTSNYDKANTDFNNSENDLQRQRQQGTNDYRSRIEQQRAQLLNSVGTLTGQRAIAEGGNYQAAMAASNPYTSRIAGILNTIDGLSATPAIREQQVNVGRPDLSGYNFARPDAPVAAVQDPSLAGNVIYGQEDQQQNPILSLFGLDDQYQTA